MSDDLDHQATDNMEQEEPDDGELDYGEPTPERQAALQAACLANVAAGKAPYAGVRITRRGELLWVLIRRGWLQTEESPAPDLRGADLSGTNLSGIDLQVADLSGTDLGYTDLSHARLSMANLERANLRAANLHGADLREVVLRGADLREARMNADTLLADATLDIRTRLVDVMWNGAPVTRLNWEDITMLGDETEARNPSGKRPDLFLNRHTTKAAMDVVGGLRYAKVSHITRMVRSISMPAWMRAKYPDALKDRARVATLLANQEAVTANRQVATVLRSQGLNEHADRLAYRAQLCQRRLLRLQRHYLRYLGSLFLGLVSGYGYRPLRSVATYVLVVLAFAGAYLLNAQFAAPHLRWDEALVLSVSAFHGRGFFTTGISLGDTLARLAAGEAIIGLLIEITFIATFTQRFFAR